MEIKIIKVQESELKKKPDKDTPLGFGKIFTDHMFQMNYEPEKGWFDPVIKKFEDIPLPPSAIVFHYAQEVFEGMKAYPRADGKIGLFRPEMNFKRLNGSAERLCMPTIPLDLQMKAVEELLKVDNSWFPAGEFESMYIRPTMIATEAALGVKKSTTYIFFIILSPSGAYFSKGFLPISVYVSEKYIRAAVGGTGTAKTGGNYAASLLGAQEAIEKGCDQVLWLDAKERRYVEEVGSMNICFVYNDTIMTSELFGSILEGVTRDSVLKMAGDLGFKTDVRKITIDEIIEGIESGKITECFGCGTAAVVSPVGQLFYREKMYTVSKDPGPVSKKLFKELTDIQWGRTQDKYGWTRIVE
ncbi:branched-chain amino acid aminotransferase [candidate division KSB1 bacterium]